VLELNSLEEINKVLDFNFKNSLKLSTLEVACPSCSKLYTINPHEIMTTKPKFDCRQCSTQFFINYPDCLIEEPIIGKIISCDALDELESPQKPSPLPAEELVSTKENIPLVEAPVALKKSKVESYEPIINCPKCDYVNIATSIECIKCSVILSKARLERDYKPAIYASPELKDLWELVLDNYDSESAHQNFIRYSALEQNLDFASSKYNVILSVNPVDEIANKMKTQLHGLAAVEIKRSMTAKPAKSVFRFFNMWTFSFLLSFSIIGLGLYFNQHKNLIGIGAFSLTLIAGLKFLQSRYK